MKRVPTHAPQHPGFNYAPEHAAQGPGFNYAPEHAAQGLDFSYAPEHAAQGPAFNHTSEHAAQPSTFDAAPEYRAQPSMFGENPALFAYGLHETAQHAMSRQATGPPQWCPQLPVQYYTEPATSGTYSAPAAQPPYEAAF
jgi:hypothetical protein